MKSKKNSQVTLMSRSLSNIEISSKNKATLKTQLPSTLSSSISFTQQATNQSETNLALIAPHQINSMITKAQTLYNTGAYSDSLALCEKIYDSDAYRADNLLLLGAIHFQLRNYSESIFYNQQCIRVDPNFAESYNNLGNSLKELGDLKGATQFYLKAIKLKPRYADAYNNLASAYLLQKQIQQAMETYQMALILNPKLIDTHINLGNLYKANGDLALAKKYYLESIKIKPEFPIAWNNLAGIFKEEGQLVTAIAYYKESLRLCPEFADAHSNLGNCLKEINQLQDAIECYKKAIQLRPDFAIAYGNLGSCYYDLNDYNEAIKNFNYAIQLESNYPDAYNNKGNCLKELNKLDEAIDAYRHCLSLKPDHPHAYNNLGNLMIDKGFIKEGIHCYITAIRLMPKFSAAHNNLGNIFQEQLKYNQAISHYLEAIKIDSSFSDAYYNLGNTYKKLKNINESISCYNISIKLDPNYYEAYHNLGLVFKDLEKYYDAIQLFLKALDLNPTYSSAFVHLINCYSHIGQWSSRDSDLKSLHEIVDKELSSNNFITTNNSILSKNFLNNLPSIEPFYSLLYDFSLSNILEISKKYSLKTKRNVILSEYHYKTRTKGSSQKLRIGYISSNFNNHPISHSLLSMFTHYDKNKYEIYCYSLNKSDGSLWRKNIEKLIVNFYNINHLHINEIVHLINQDNIHVLINLDGYLKDSCNEIFALKPCPIQINFLGYPSTIGNSDFIQYIIADNISIPNKNREYYSEKVLHLPHTYYLNDHKISYSHIVKNEEILLNLKRSTYNLDNDKFIFCNFNQIFKITPKIFTVWMNILKKVNNSILWLSKFPEEAEKNLRSEALKQGIEEDRIVFSNLLPREEHIMRCYLADLYLDTPQYNACSGACDSL